MKLTIKHKLLVILAVYICFIAVAFYTQYRVSKLLPAIETATMSMPDSQTNEVKTAVTEMQAKVKTLSVAVAQAKEIEVPQAESKEPVLVQQEASLDFGGLAVASIFEATVTRYSGEDDDVCQLPGCPMASGKTAYVGAVACPRKIPLGTKVMIENRMYVCEDRLALRYDDRFDIFTGYGSGAQRRAIQAGIHKTTIRVLK